MSAQVGDLIVAVGGRTGRDGIHGATFSSIELTAESEKVSGGAVQVIAPTDPGEIARIWRWRDGVSIAVSAQRGGKVSEDIVVPLDRLLEAIERTWEIGHRHALPSCSWGHAGDGNLHSTFMIEPGSADELERARAASEELFALAVELGGSISGEHGLGYVKSGHLARQWSPRLVRGRTGAPVRPRRAEARGRARQARSPRRP